MLENIDARRDAIALIMSDKKNIINYKNIRWEGKKEAIPVYRIPIEYLVFNAENGRILSRTITLKTQHQEINVESLEGQKKIKKLLWNSSVERNRNTERDIRANTQLKSGIVTQDGYIVDGNRRFMILNEIVANPKNDDPEKFKFFEAAILPVNLADKKHEIIKLETRYQMGEDEKVSYNATEKYMRAKQLFDLGDSISDIKKNMNRSEGDIKKLLDTMNVMDDYLEYFEYQDIYTALDGREDFFLSLTKWMQTYLGEQSTKAFDGYTDSDVDDLRSLCYEYIRAKFGGDGKKFRKIADGLKENHFFGNTEIWNDFKDQHATDINPIIEHEVKVDYNSNDIESHIADRDEKYKNKVVEFLEENLSSALSRLINKKHHSQPAKLAVAAKNALHEINTKAESFTNQDTKTALTEVSDLAFELVNQGNSGTTIILKTLLDRLEKIVLTYDKDIEEQKELLQLINKKSFLLKKDLGG